MPPPNPLTRSCRPQTPTLLRELKKRLEELECQVKAARSGEGAGALEAEQARARQLSASLARKDGMLRELRDRLEQQQVRDGRWAGWMTWA